MSNLAKKDHILDLSQFQVEFDEEQDISEYLADYDAPTTIERTWLLQVAKAFSMVEVYRKSIKHVLAAQVTLGLERDFFSALAQHLGLCLAWCWGSWRGSLIMMINFPGRRS